MSYHKTLGQENVHSAVSHKHSANMILAFFLIRFSHGRVMYLRTFHYANGVHAVLYSVLVERGDGRFMESHAVCPAESRKFCIAWHVRRNTWWYEINYPDSYSVAISGLGRIV